MTSFNMQWDTYFTDGFEVSDFYEVVDTLTSEEEAKAEPKEPQLRVEIPTPTSSTSKSPRRRTFGAQFQELRDEIASLRLEIEIRDAHIFTLLHEIKAKKIK